LLGASRTDLQLGEGPVSVTLDRDRYVTPLGIVLTAGELHDIRVVGKLDAPGRDVDRTRQDQLLPW
jgi:hypothetical protein